MNWHKALVNPKWVGLVKVGNLVFVLQNFIVVINFGYFPKHITERLLPKSLIKSVGLLLDGNAKVDLIAELL